MAELVDALVSNTNVFGRAGSTPALGTKPLKFERLFLWKFFLIFIHRMMKQIFSLLFICLSLLGFAQPVQENTFYFNLIDTKYNFNLAEDFYQVKIIQKSNKIEIKSGDFTYEILPIYGNLSLKGQSLACSYTETFTNHCNFLITRKAPYIEEEMKFGISNLLNDDFANIQFSPNHQIAFVMPQNPDDRFYILKAGKSNFGGRDISCFLYDGCTPNWVLSEKGIVRRDSLLKDYSIEINQKLKDLAAEKLKLFLPNGLDTIMVDLVCATSQCSNPVGMINCQLTADTSCKTAIFEYRFKRFKNNYDQKIIINAQYPDYAWFTYDAYNSISLSLRDKTMLSRTEVLAKLIEDNFITITEEPLLSNLGLLPQFVKQKPIIINGLVEINPSSEVIFDYSSPEDFPMLGYSFTNEEYSKSGEVLVYQYWISARNGEVFRKTTYSYNLRDE